MPDSLSPAVRRAYERMEPGVEYTESDLRTNRAGANALLRAGLVKRRLTDGGTVKRPGSGALYRLA